MLNLFWIFECLTIGPFAGPLSADCQDVSHLGAVWWAIKCQLVRCRKSSRISVAMDILNFDPKIGRKV